jgi:hypothetical protein
VLVGNGWTAGWDSGNVLALFINPDIAGNSSMIAILCGPKAGAAACASGQPGSDLVVGNITRASILGTSIVDYDTLFVLCAPPSWLTHSNAAESSGMLFALPWRLLRQMLALSTLLLPCVLSIARAWQTCK